jgi:hypothetical protein
MLLVGGVLVFVISVVAAIGIATSPPSSVPGFEDLEREGRGFVALATFGAGLAGAGILMGLGAILILMVADRRDRS